MELRKLASALLACLSRVALGGQCPASWPKDELCLWPYQQQFKNFSVATAPDKKEACCAACANEDRCLQWAVQIGQGAKAKLKDVCILNAAHVSGAAPQDPSFGCLSGTKQRPMCPQGCPSNPHPPRPAPKAAMNVLFFAVDDLRPEFEVFGGVPGTPMPKMHTPNINALAAKSLVLTKNYVQQAVCSPTRQSLLTGRRPDRTRVYDLYSFYRDVGANYTTIPQFFRVNGYKTIGMGKIFHPGHASGEAPGVLGDDICCSWSNDTYFHAPNLEYWSGKSSVGGNAGRSWMSVEPHVEAEHPLPDSQTADNAVETLKALKQQRDGGDSRPFFLAVGFHKPHLPFVASKKYFDFYPNSSIEMPGNQYPPKGMPNIAWSAYGELRAYLDQAPLHESGQPGTVLPQDDVRELRRAYYASVTQTDDMLGNVIAALESTGFSKSTVISFWGDHGWQLGEHGEWCKHTNFEFAARAPMMVHVPGLTDKGITTKHYSEHVDLFPTLTEAATGIKLYQCPSGDQSFKVLLCTEGSSLVPLMRNPSNPVKKASFSQYPRGYQKHPDGVAMMDELLNSVAAKPSTSACIQQEKSCTMGYTLVTMIDGHEYRYTEWADFNTPGHKLEVNWDRIVGVELYNHSADPGENFNINATQKTYAVLTLSAILSHQLRAGPDAARIHADESLLI